MLDPAIAAQLRGHLDQLAHPVRLLASFDDSVAGRAMRALLDAVAGLGARVSVEEAPDPRTPSFAVQGAGAAGVVRFALAPQGSQFTSLALALLQAGGRPPLVEPALAQRIRALDGDYLFETYVSFDCHNCADVVQMLNTLAALNPRVRAVAIDGSVFRDEAEARDVRVVPMSFLNGAHFGQGRTSIEEILARLEAGAAAQAQA